MTDNFFDFTTGHSADNLKGKGVESFRSWRNLQMEEIKNIGYEKTEVIEGYPFYRSGEDLYLLFSYKKRFYTEPTKSIWSSMIERKWPKYHPCFCDAVKNYKGYAYGNKLPVNIFSQDEKTTFHDMYLRLCKYCEKEIFKSFWASGNKAWHDTVLEFVADEVFPQYRQDGYHVMWKQISEAYREKVGWKCESCGIKLGSEADKRYLHTHHRDGDPKNNRSSNFQALCLLCHALEHKNKIDRFRKFSEVELFIQNYESQLSRAAIQNFYKVKEQFSST